MSKATKEGFVFLTTRMCVFSPLSSYDPAVLDFTTKTTNNNKNAHLSKKEIRISNDYP